MPKHLLAIALVAGLALLLFGCVEPESHPFPTANYTPPAQPPSPPANTTVPPAQNVSWPYTQGGKLCKALNYTYVEKNGSSGYGGYCSFGTGECHEDSFASGTCCLRDPECASVNCTEGPAYCSSQLCRCPVKQKNTTANATPPTFPPTTTMSISDLLDDGLKQADAAVYSDAAHNNITYSGSNDYVWVRTKMGSTQPPEDIPLGEPMENLDVLFNDKTIDSLRGLAFTVYAGDNATASPSTTKGLAIFLDQPRVMEDSLENGTLFRLEYKPPQHNKLLEKCAAENRQLWLTQSGKQLAVYFFGCAIAWAG